MSNLEKAVDRIKILECPTGELENRVKGILEDYNIADRKEIMINRYQKADKDGSEAYRAEISGNMQQYITILAKSGMDDYVSKVVDVYID